MIDGLPIVSLTPSVLLGIVVLLIFTGGLVPWRTHRQALKANAIKDEQIKELLQQNSDLLHDFGPTIVKLMQDVRAQAAQVEPGDTRRTALGETPGRAVE